MELVCCNLCGSSDLESVYRAPDLPYHPDEWFTVNACRRCGLGFVSPRPSTAEMGDYYPKTFYDGFETDDEYHQRRYAIEAGFVERIATKRTTRRLLDIGCASGGFPRAMRARGWTVDGVEVSQSSKPITDFHVYSQPFPDVPIDTPRFDAVTAWAVLEHVHDPMAHFRKAARVLEKGGVFVFLVTNFDSLASRHLFLEDVPRHLYFFTEATVRTYLEHNGFELLAVDYSNKIYSMMPVGWLRYFVARALRQPYDWDDSRLTHNAWLVDRHLPRTLRNLARFAVRHPLSLVDRATASLRGRWEMMRHTYGIVTYQARKL